MLADQRSTLTGEAIEPALRDGYEIHRTALRHGFDVTLYPRQVLMARHPSSGTPLSFVHGIPQSSTLAAVTFAQDKRMRREMLSAAGLPVPEGMTFAIGQERDTAKHFAHRVGWPVVVKPVGGDNMREVFAGLRNEKALDEAIDHFRTPEMERPTFTRTAYSLTLLLEPDEEDGRTVAPAKYQLLVERHVSGHYLRVLVVDGTAVSAVQCPAGLADPAGEPNREVLGELHPSIVTLAINAAQTIPGLAVAAVDMVVDDHRRAASAQEIRIVEFSERPSLSAQAGVSEELSRQLGDLLLTQHAREVGVNGDPPQEVASIDFAVEGVTDPPGVISAIGDAATELGVTPEQLRVTDQVEGTAEGALHGPPESIARIFELLLAGRLAGQRAMLVEEQQRRG